MYAHKTIVVRDVAGSANVLYVFDEVDVANADDFENELLSMPGDGLIVVELSDCRFMDSKASSLLTRAYVKFADRLRIVVPQGSKIERLLLLLRAYPLLPIVHSLEEALAT